MLQEIALNFKKGIANTFRLGSKIEEVADLYLKCCKSQ